MIGRFLKKRGRVKWEPRFYCRVYGQDYDDICNVLGKPKKSPGGFIFWTSCLADIDPELHEDSHDMFFQISNRDPMKSDGQPSFIGDREQWHMVFNDQDSLRHIIPEVGFSRHGSVSEVP